MTSPHAGPPAPRYALLSIGAAVTTMGLKSGAYLMTGSVGLFSDAAESFVNLLAAGVAFWALSFAARPADEDHAFGHSKAEYLASAFEGIAIVGAAIVIAEASWGRIQHPQPLTNVWAGLAISVVASGVNGGVAATLFRAGKRLDSITLRSDAHHLMTDVWTSAGVVVGVSLVKLTGWNLLDPLAGLAVATYVVWQGTRILIETSRGLLDSAIPDADRRILDEVLARFTVGGVTVHSVKTRLAGPRRFVEMHVLVPGGWSVQKGHDLCEAIEGAVTTALSRVTVLTHLEPIEDPASWEHRVEVAGPGPPESQ